MTPSLEQKRKIALDVYYEYLMFNQAFERMQRNGINDVVEEEGYLPSGIVRQRGTSFNQLEDSADLEVFLLHARNLRAFLCDSPENDDVSAAHFVDGWENGHPSLGSYLRSIHTKLNKRLAHITYARIRYRGAKWNVVQIKHEMDSLWRAFWNALSDERKQWFSIAAVGLRLMGGNSGAPDEQSRKG